MAKRADQYRCSECEFELYVPIVSFEVATLGLYDDARYPGRCILALNRHTEDFPSLSAPTTRAFVAEAQEAARAIASVVDASRMNFAILGNAVPHLHWHIIPRFGARDPASGRSPWSTREPARPLSNEDRHSLVTQIALALVGERKTLTRLKEGS